MIVTIITYGRNGFLLLLVGFRVSPIYHNGMKYKIIIMIIIIIIM